MTSTDTIAEINTVAIVDADVLFEQIYREHFDAIFRYVWYRTFNRALTEDIVAETFLRAWRHLAGFTDIRGGMPAWLTTIARNLVADHFKRAIVRAEVSIAGTEMRDSDDLAPPVDDDVLAGITVAAVRAAVLRLNDHQRACITLRYLDGLSIAETADAMCIAEGAVKTLQWRAIKTLAADWNLKRTVTA